jgi:hypothetical protein
VREILGEPALGVLGVRRREKRDLTHPRFFVFASTHTHASVRIFICSNTSTRGEMTQCAPMPATITESCRFVDEVTSGDPKRALEAIVGRLAVELDQAEGARNVAVLARALLDVFRSLERLPKPSSGLSVADQLVARREERLTARGEVPVQRNGGRTKEEYPRRSGKPKSS